jgi:hypothetical protein
VTLTLAGVLPVSGVNLGLGLVPPVLQAEIIQFGIDLTRLGIATLAKVQAGFNVPNLAALEADIALLPPTLASMLDPTKFLTLCADLNVDLVAKLGVVDEALELALEAEATLTAGLSVGGIAAWSYSGPARGLAEMSPAFSGPWSIGLVVATESLGSWGQFGVSVNTGPSKTATPGGPPKLTSLGQLTGADWCPGLFQLASKIHLFVLKLQGLKAGFEMQLDMTVGVNLPDVSDLLVLLAQIASDAEHLLDNLLNVSVDLDAEIDWVQVRMNAIVGLAADIGAQLSAGGLALWLYLGGTGQLVGEIARALAGGIPGGSGPVADIRALVLAHETPSVWTPFGAILGGS